MVVRRGLRFIPTHVGNAWPGTTSGSSSPVHPHARGERGGLKMASKRRDGSSPRTWGTLFRFGLRWRHDRFIPTHVGNARTPGRRPRATPVHPHARGERARAARRISRILGSSPRTWGTQLFSFCAPQVFRFIPTHVGNARSTTGRRPMSTVHPHARGERRARRRETSPNNGSSPRTWGTLWGDRNADVLVRFIPTHVGNASAPRTGRSGRPVHPHARGERGGRLADLGIVHGSSPRTWGTQWRA